MSVRSGERRIRDDLAVEFSFDPARQALAAHWTPRAPSRLTADELALYRRTRNEFCQQLAAKLGGPVVVIDA